MTGLGLIIRLFGVRVVEGPREVRLTLPAYLLRLSPGLLDVTARKLRARGGRVEKLNKRSLLIAVGDKDV